MSIDLRPRTRAALGCAAAFGCLLIPARHSSMIRLAWMSAFAPVQKVLARGGQSLAFTLDSISAWRHLARDNRRLRESAASLLAELERERARSRLKDEKLRTLGAFRRYQQGLGAGAAEEVAECEVIGRGIGAQPDLVLIDRGSRHGLQPGMMVAAGGSVVGQVRGVAASVSSVLLVSSPGCAVAGCITRTGQRGVAVGGGDGRMLLKYITKERPKPGDAVVTSGGDGLTPRHFLLGRVSVATRRPGKLAYRVIVTPVCDLDRLASVVALRPAIPASEFPRESEAGGSER